MRVKRSKSESRERLRLARYRRVVALEHHNDNAQTQGQLAQKFLELELHVRGMVGLHDDEISLALGQIANGLRDLCDQAMVVSSPRRRARVMRCR